MPPASGMGGPAKRQVPKRLRPIERVPAALKSTASLPWPNRSGRQLERSWPETRMRSRARPGRPKPIRRKAPHGGMRRRPPPRFQKRAGRMALISRLSRPRPPAMSQPTCCLVGLFPWGEDPPGWRAFLTMTNTRPELPKDFGFFFFFFFFPHLFRRHKEGPRRALGRAQRRRAGLVDVVRSRDDSPSPRVGAAPAISGRAFVPRVRAAKPQAKIPADLPPIAFPNVQPRSIWRNRMQPPDEACAPRPVFRESPNGLMRATHWRAGALRGIHRKVLSAPASPPRRRADGRARNPHGI